MADLTNVLGGPWSPHASTPNRQKTPDEQIRDAMLAVGIEPPDDIHFDGKIHRFNHGKKRDKSAWYCLYADGVPAGRFGDWREGIEQPFKADIGRSLTSAEEMAHARRMAEARAQRDAEMAKTRAIAADTCTIIWDGCSESPADHPYLTRKGVKPHGARITGDGRLVLPAYDEHGELATLQYIDQAGEKQYHGGGARKGTFWWVGDLNSPGTIYIGEGFATSASIHDATARPCVITYSSGNLPAVAQAIKQLYPAAELVIVADHDTYTAEERERKAKKGPEYAAEAAALTGARVIIPPIEGMDANDYAQAGHDLAALIAPAPDDQWLIPADDFCAQPAPIAWLVKHWLQDQALIMVHGPSGGGKTFAVLDWCLRIASSTPEWMACRVKPGNVVYLAGEGHHGLRGRVAAWKHHHAAGPLSMWLSRDGCDLNTAEGYTRVANNLKALPARPCLIVVDTLHRFLLGDENSAQDAKTMLDACNSLMREFACSVLLVHHTGVSDEAQHRARGSSAWRGALDIEISIVPAVDGRPMEIIQRKSKDAEMAQPKYARLESVQLPGWFDEDGEPVTSAILVESEPPIATAQNGKLGEYLGYFKRAWFATGAEHVDGFPFIRRQPLINIMPAINSDWKTEKTIKNNLTPSGEFIGSLTKAKLIEEHHYIGDGWRVCDPILASQMMLSR